MGIENGDKNMPREKQAKGEKAEFTSAKNFGAKITHNIERPKDLLAKYSLKNTQGSFLADWTPPSRPKNLNPVDAYPSPLSKKAAQGKATRAALIDIAREAFCRYGYAETATESLVERGQLTRGALYHHFGSKAGLFRAVVEQVSGDIAGAMHRRMVQTREPWGALEQGCLAFLDAALKPEVRQIYLLDGPVVLGWRNWRQIDLAAPAGLLRQAVNSCLESTPSGAAALSAAAISTMLTGAVNEMAFAVADAPANKVLRVSHERALIEMIRALRHRVDHLPG